MPASDPSPPPGQIPRHFVRMARVGAFVAVAMAALAVVQVASGDSARHAKMLITAALGLGFIMMLGIALMMLSYSSKRMKHDLTAVDHRQKDDNDSRS